MKKQTMNDSSFNDLCKEWGEDFARDARTYKYDRIRVNHLLVVCDQLNLSSIKMLIISKLHDEGYGHQDRIEMALSVLVDGTKRDRRSVQRALKELRNDGFITWESRRGRLGMNLYDLTPFLARANQVHRELYAREVAKSKGLEVHDAASGKQAVTAKVDLVRQPMTIASIEADVDARNRAEADAAHAAAVQAVNNLGGCVRGERVFVGEEYSGLVVTEDGTIFRFHGADVAFCEAVENEKTRLQQQRRLLAGC